MNQPNLIESLKPCSGQYSAKQDLRLNGWLAVAALVYVAELFLLKRHPQWPPLTRGLVALTPLLPGLLYLRSWVRFVRGLDELQRQVQQEAFLFAAVGTILVAVVIDTLKANGLTIFSAEDGFSLGVLMGSMLVLRLVGGAVATRRFK